MQTFTSINSVRSMPLLLLASKGGLPRKMAPLTRFCLKCADVLVFLRIYLLGRFLRNWLGFDSSSYYVHLIGKSPRHLKFCLHTKLTRISFPVSLLSGAFHRVDVMSIWFTIKYTFQRFPFQSTVTALLIDWILTSAALNFLERCGQLSLSLYSRSSHLIRSHCASLTCLASGTNEQMTNMNEAIWLTIVTMTSVGYGELAPRTLGGKLTIVFGAIVGGTIITCLLRAVLIDALLVTPQEKIVLDVVYFHQFVRKQKEAAVFLIQQAWRWHRDQRKRESRYRHRVYRAAEAFRLLRFTQPSTSLLSSSSSISSSSNLQLTTSATSKQLQGLHEQMKIRRAQSLHRLHATTQLFRNIADTSSE